jgi:membrane AbrB-like protein
MVWPPELRAQLTALIAGVSCGFGAYFLGLPLPWMLGPMLGNTVLAVAGVPVVGPDKWRSFVIPVIGVMLGSAITVEIFSQLGGWILTLALLPVYLLMAAGVSFLVYRRIGGYDAVTAFYAAMPGGLNEMLIMGGEAGGNERKIALAHAARVMLVILFVALFFGLFLGVRSGGGGRNWVSLSALSPPDYALLILAAIIGVWAAKRLRLPAAPVFGPMIISAIFHIAGWVEIGPPTVFIIAAQMVVGTIIGTRFAGATFAEVRRDIALAVIGSSAMLVVSIAFGALVAWSAQMSLSQAFLAYAPGGLTEMSLLTLSMNQDVAYVSTMHIIRITLVIAIAPLVFRLARAKITKTK